MAKKRKSIVGLDIGSSAIKAVELKPVRGGFELVHIAHLNLQSDTIVDGHIIDLNHVSDSINRIWTEQAIKTNSKLDSMMTSLALSQSEGLIGRTITSSDGMVSGAVAGVRVVSGGAVAILDSGQQITLDAGITVS